MKLYEILTRYNLLDRVEMATGEEFEALKQWDFKINYRAKSRFGCCKPKHKLVEVTSEYYVHGSVKGEEFDDFVNTLLHETAHVIVLERYNGYRYGGKVQAHGHEWRSVMGDLGITKIKRCGSSDVLAKVKEKTAKHRYTCKDCGYVYETQRRIQNLPNRLHGECKYKELGGKLIHRQLR